MWYPPEDRVIGNPRSLDPILDEVCSNREPVETLTGPKWFELLKTTFGVTGYWKGEDVEDFEIDQMVVTERQTEVSDHLLGEEGLREWVRLHWVFPCDNLEEHGKELIALKERVPEAHVSLVVLEADLVHCGTLTTGCVRVALLDGGAWFQRYLTPYCGSLRHTLDGTSGPVWESPDDCPDEFPEE